MTTNGWEQHGRNYYRRDMAGREYMVSYVPGQGWNRREKEPGDQYWELAYTAPTPEEAMNV